MEKIRNQKVDATSRTKFNTARKFGKFNLPIREKDLNRDVVYVDGACRMNKRGIKNVGAMGFVIPKDKKYFGYAVETTTNNLMEFGAAYLAIRHMIFELHLNKFVVHTDCNLLVQQLERGYMKNLSLGNLLGMIIGLVDGRDISLQHIRSVKRGKREIANYADLVCNAAIDQYLRNNDSLYTNIFFDDKRLEELNDFSKLVKAY